MSRLKYIENRINITIVTVMGRVQKFHDLHVLNPKSVLISQTWEPWKSCGSHSWNPFVT